LFAFDVVVTLRVVSVMLCSNIHLYRHTYVIIVPMYIMFCDGYVGYYALVLVLVLLYNVSVVLSFFI